MWKCRPAQRQSIPLVASCILICVYGCSASVTRTGYETSALQTAAIDCSKIVIKNHAVISEDVAVVVGRVSASDSGFSTECNERYVLGIFKTDACALGADIVNITKESQPGFWSSCYQAEADLIKLKDKTQLGTLASDSRYASEAVGARSKKAADCLTQSVIGASVGGLLGYAIATAVSADCQGLDNTEPTASVPEPVPETP